MSKQRFTLVFDGCMPKNLNPFITETPFGTAVAASVDDAFERYDRLDEECERLRDALHEIANGKGYFGSQAREYKRIAQEALEGADQ